MTGSIKLLTLSVYMLYAFTNVKGAELQMVIKILIVETSTNIANSDNKVIIILNYLQTVRYVRTRGITPLRTARRGITQSARGTTLGYSVTYY